MPTLSVIMIVKNEAKCLPECLDSVRRVADEIVVADTGSSDHTLAIARAFGARTLAIPWEDDFAKARNRSMAAATGDWLLHLDADEVLDPAGAQRMRHLVDHDGLAADAIELVLANYCDDPRAWRWVPVEPGSPFARGHAGYIKVALLRLFRNGCGFEYREPVHENITQSVIERGGRIRHEDIVIHHYGYRPEEQQGGAKAGRYLAIARKKAEAAPGDTKALHDWAEQALACNLPAEAETACRAALAIDDRHLNAATTLANILLNRGAFTEARTLLEGLNERGIAAPHLVTALAAIDCREGRLGQARERLETVCAAEPHALMARLYLARVYDRLGACARALDELRYVQELAPTIVEFQQRVDAHGLRTQGEALFQAGRPAEALTRFVAALRLDPEDPLLHNGLGVVLHALGETEKARVSFRRALQLAPGMPEATANLDALSSTSPASLEGGR